MRLSPFAVLVTRNTDDGLTHQGAIKKLCKRLFDSGLLTYKLSEPEDWDSLEAKFMVREIHQ